MQRAIINVLIVVPDAWTPREQLSVTDIGHGHGMVTVWTERIHELVDGDQSIVDLGP